MKSLNFNDVLADFQYKPNFSYGAYRKETRGYPRDDIWWIRIVMLVENSRGRFVKWNPQRASRMEFSFLDDYDAQHRIPPMRDELMSPSRPLIEVVGNYPIPYFGPEDEAPFVQWMCRTIHKMEQHETDEWLRYKGELLNDPHKEVGL